MDKKLLAPFVLLAIAFNVYMFMQPRQVVSAQSSTEILMLQRIAQALERQTAIMERQARNCR